MRSRSIMTLAAAVSVAASTVTVGLLGSAGTSQAAVPHPYYLSLGDSYAIGYQPGLGGTPGITGYIAGKLKLQPENFGCGGATTSSMMHAKGYGDPAGQDAVPYSGIPQEQAALDFIAAHRGAVRLITISIGGNNFDGCSTPACVQSAMPSMGVDIASMMSTFSTALAQASDGGARITGLTYPEVNLGLYVYPTVPPTSANVSSAQSSVAAFDQLINPTLANAYQTVTDGSFVTVTSAPYRKATQGDDTPLTNTERYAPYGRVPVAVGEVCDLTWFCTQGNIHATARGYQFIGKLAVAQYRSF